MENNYKKGIRNIHLTIAGTGPYWDACKERIETPNMYNLKISFIEKNEIPDLMLTHHFLILPYRDSTQSGPVMIAANYSLPIIAPRMNSFMDIYNEDSALFYDQGRLEESLSHVSRMCKSDYCKLRENVANIRNLYSENNIACNYIRFFNTIIEKNQYDN